jgi:MFS family permease
MGRDSDNAASAGLGRAGLMALLFGGGLAGMAQMTIVPSLPQLATRFADAGDGAFIAQQIMTITGPALAIGAPLLGWLAGYLGKRNVLLASALVFALAGIAGAFAPDFWTLLATRVLLGISCGGVGATSMGLLADHYDGPVRDRLIGWVTAIGGGASLVSLVAAGALIEFGGWRAPFSLYLIGVIIFLVALPALAREKPSSAASRAAASAGSVRAAFGYFILIFVVSIFMNMVAVQGIFLLQSEGITSPTVQSIVLDMSTVGAIVGGYAFGFVRPRLGFSTILALVWALLGVGTLGFALVGTTAGLAIFALVAGLGAGFMSPLTGSAILAVVPPTANARAMGMALAALFLGLMANPYVVKPLRAAFGFQGAFIWIGGGALAGAALTLLWRMRGNRRAALVPGIATNEIRVT